MGPIATIEAVTLAVDRAEGLDDAVAAIAAYLSTSHPVDRVSVRLVLAENESLVVLAVWTQRSTRVERGTRLSAAATSLPEILRSGGPVIVARAQRKHLLDDVLAREGIRSFATVALHKDHRVVALLSASSARRDAFVESEAPAFSSLAAAVERRLVEIIRKMVADDPELLRLEDHQVEDRPKRDEPNERDDHRGG